MKDRIKRRIDAAMGQIPCDLVLRNARYLDVFNAMDERRHRLLDGVIVGVEGGLKAARTIDLRANRAGLCGCPYIEFMMTTVI